MANFSDAEDFKKTMITIQGEDGGSATISPYGAQALSWITADGVEQLFLSPRSVYRAGAAIRGGAGFSIVGVSAVFGPAAARCVSLRASHGGARVSHRNADTTARDRHRAQARKHRIFDPTQTVVAAAESSIRHLFPERPEEADESDLRQLSKTIAEGVQLFVTRDAGMHWTATAVPKPAYCRIVHSRPRYIDAWMPRVNGKAPGSPSRASRSAGRSAAPWRGGIGMPEEVCGSLTAPRPRGCARPGRRRRGCRRTALSAGAARPARCPGWDGRRPTRGRPPARR